MAVKLLTSCSGPTLGRSFAGLNVAALHKLSQCTPPNHTNASGKCVGKFVGFQFYPTVCYSSLGTEPPGLCRSFGCECRLRIRFGYRKGGLSVRNLSYTGFSGLASSRMGTLEEVMDPVQQRLMFEDECILVDENDNVVGHENKYNCHLWEKIVSDNLLHRAFSVFLFNSKNELLLQKRSATKVTFPLVWTNTCCSHPLYRENELIEKDHIGVKNAAQRKLFDELGIVAEDVPVEDFMCLSRIHYRAPSDGKWGEHEVDYLVFIKRDVKIQPNPDEVADYQFVNKEQLQEIVRKAKAGEDGVKLSPWFALVVENFLFDWWKRIEDDSLVEAVDMKAIHKL